MAEKKLELNIISPDMDLENAPPKHADMVILFCTTGELGILPGRAPCNMLLGTGNLRIFENEVETRFKIDGGVASVKDNLVTVITNSIVVSE